MRIHISISSKVQRLSRQKFDKLSATEQEKYFKTYPNSTFKETESSNASLKNFGLNSKKDLEGLASSLGESYSTLHSLLKEPTFKKVFKSTKHIAETGMAILKIPNSALHSAFKEMDKAGTFNKIKKGTMKADEFLKKYPIIKKMAGPVIAGALVMQWVNMSFSGDFDDDFDVGTIADALSGDFSIEELVGTPAGLKSIAQLGLGILSGGALSFPWHSSLTIGFAVTYTAAKKAGNTKLAKKALSKLKELMDKSNNKTKNSTMEA